MTRTLLILSALLCALAPATGLAQNPCTDAARVIDQRGQSGTDADRGQMRLRCVKFVLSHWDGEFTHGWVEWHEVLLGESLESHRLGLFPAEVGWTLVFARLPGHVGREPGMMSLSVLLPRSRWWLVNATRHGWQLRSGTISDPGMHTLRKLFKDVALNAGIGRTGEALEDWWPWAP